MESGAPIKNYVINLFILAIAIALVCVAKSNFSELFVPNVNLPPNNTFFDPATKQFIQVPHNNIPLNPWLPQGGHPMGQPMMYPNQIWPNGIPYYPQIGGPINADGMKVPCKDGDCGATGMCIDGTCRGRETDKTVMGVNSVIR